MILIKFFFENGEDLITNAIRVQRIHKPNQVHIFQNIDNKISISRHDLSKNRETSEDLGYLETIRIYYSGHEISIYYAESIEYGTDTKDT